MKVLVTGAEGMLARDLIPMLRGEGWEVVGWDLADLDITSETAADVVASLGPDLVINCAAYTDVDGAETHGELAMAVNGVGPGNLARGCAGCGAVLVHLSTDYIFGDSTSSRDENGSPAPTNVYGQTKLAGEVAVRAQLERHYIVRTSWLFGRHGRNFVDTILRLSRERSEIMVVNDQRGKPTWTMDLARGIIDLITGNHGFGTYHRTNEGECSWFDFASEIVRLAGSSCRVVPCTSDQFPRPARRPALSSLENSLLPPLADWQSALARYLDSGSRTEL